MSTERKPSKAQLEAMQCLVDRGVIKEKSRGYACRMTRSLLDSGFAETSAYGIRLTDAGVAALTASRGGAK